MRIKTNSIKAIRDFFDEELKTFFSSEEIRFYFYWCCEHFMNMPKTQVIENMNSRVSESVMLKFNFAVKDLKMQKPIQYILENCDFSGLSLRVTPDTLIPRPETEELVQKILKENKNFSGKILDICTGSGCIALALKKYFPDAMVQGLDISEKAVDIARENAEKNHLAVDFFVADIFHFDETKIVQKQFDLIVGNPPYVRYSEKSEMQKNVLNYEPHQALFVDDENPLIFYHAIANFAQKHLDTSGKIYFELNENFGNETAAILENSGFSDIEVFKDFRNKDRFVRGKKMLI